MSTLELLEELPVRRSETIRNKVFHLLRDEDHSGASHAVRIILACLIALSVVSVILETEPYLEDHYHDTLRLFEYLTVAIFSIEYILRVWTCVESSRWRKHHRTKAQIRIRYIFSFLAVVDLISILPAYLPALFVFDLRFLRILRMMRLARILKIAHLSNSLTLIHGVIFDKRKELVACLFIMINLLILASSAMFFAEHDTQPKVFTSIPATFWWAIQTLTTMSYGDMMPISQYGKFCSGAIAIIGIGVFALPTSIIMSGFLEKVHKPHDVFICSACKMELERIEQAVD